MQALLMCDTVPNVLAKTQTVCVHSVFHHACNLQTPSQELITLQTFDMPLAPRGIVVPCSNLLTLFEQGEQITVSDGQHLMAPSCEIQLDRVPKLSVRLSRKITIEALIGLKHALDDFLPENAPINGMYQMLQGQSSIFPTAALVSVQDAIQGLQTWLKNPEVSSEQLEGYFQHLIGFGIGLTPSADDFLVGVLLIMDALKEPKRGSMASVLTQFLSRTTDISKAMLQNACEGRYGVQLLALFNTSCDLPVAIAQVVDYGHSSGHDMLCGAAFALRCLLPDANSSV